METLFRFVLKRPPVERDDETPTIELAQDTSFQEALGQAQDSDAVRAGVKTAARQFTSSAEYVTDYDDLALGEPLAALGEALDTAETEEAVDNAAVTEFVLAEFDADPAELVARDEFEADDRRLRDSILAIKYLPEEHDRPIHHLTRALRDMEVIRRVAAEEAFPDGPAALQRYRARPLELPTATDLRSVLAHEDDVRIDDDNRREVEDLIDRFTQLKTAVDELSTVGGDRLVQSPSTASGKSLPPAELRPQRLFAKGISDGLFLSAALAPAYTPRGVMQPRDPDDRRPNQPDDRDEDAVTTQHLVTAARAALASGNEVRTTLSGRQSFQPVDQAEVGFRLTADAVASLSKETRAVADEREIELTATALDETVDALRSEMRVVTGELNELGARTEEHSFKRIGDSMVLISSPVETPWADISIGIPGFALPFPIPVPDMRVPDSHAEIAPAGIADLLVVKQQLTGYEAMDVSHVANVLQGERKAREHRRRRETEEVLFRESEVTTSEEHELETTDRFEMARETSETIAEESSLKAGLSVSGKYGPTVEFSASAEGSTSRSKEQATKTASSFAKEVTSRSASKLTERILERESLRVTNEVEDTNEHVLDNTDGDDHVVGIYQWLHKNYEAQIYNYGLRTMYDFMVPEPGAFLIEAFRRAHTSAVELKKPTLFPLQPDQIHEYNYPFWVHEYGATDVSPPPEPYRTKSIDYSAGGGDDKTDYHHSGQVQVDEGYRAIHASVGVVDNIWDDDAVVDVLVGRRAHRFHNDASWVWSTPLDNERDSVPFALKTFDVSDIGVVAEVKCQRTERAMDQWRHDTHAKLTDAYRARVAEYEEKLAALEAAAGPEIEGRSAAANRELMRDELKKACTSIMTEQHFDLFDAVEPGSNGLAQVDLHENEAEGPYVRFFEQAFEWEHMTWVTYPYYWGRKSEWTSRVAFEDADPMFNDFLKAGYCRVSVPVREGFEGAVDHFMTVGDIWAGGPLPTISSDLYLPIADELAERLDRPGDEVPEGDPWEVTLPTSLVSLRTEEGLPAWEQDADGNWVAQ